MIEVRKLCKKYGNKFAVKDVNFKIDSGQIVGFLGPNGAGKTTTLNILTGYLASTSGDVLINGFDILEDPINAKKSIGYLPDTPPLYPELTVYEQLKFAYDLKKLPKNNKKDELEKIMEKVKVSHMRNRLTKNLSKGYKQRVGLCIAMLGNPEILILDEPTIGLDPKQVLEMRQIIKGLSKTHTILFSSHILSEVSAICDTVMVINNGELVDTKTMEDFKTSLKGTNHITIRVKDTYDNVKNALKGIEVKSIKNIGSFENNTLDIEVLAKDSEDIREKVFKALSKNNVNVLTLKAKDYSLEEIFLKLTNNAKINEIETEDNNSND